MRFDCPHCSQPIQIVPDLASDSIEVVCPSCGSQFPISLNEETATVPIAAPPKLEHFDLLQPIGAGQFGRVWKAADRDLKRTVAIKIPHKRRLSKSEASFFLREAQAAARLDHPNIVAVFEVGQIEQTIYIVSQYVDGPSMREWISSKRNNPKALAEVCRQTALGLACAHEHGIVHRDLKPGNIILDSESRPHITDFGLAKQQHHDATIALDGRVLGTLAYMSPEQLRDSHDVDHRADIYALGVVLYEALTGERPFRGAKKVLAESILHDPPKPPRQIDPTIPRDLETICLRCLEKSPQQRYQSAKDLAADLESFVQGEPITARPIAPWVRGARWLRKRPAFASAVVLALVATLLAAVVALGPDRHAPDPSHVLVRLETVPPRANVVFVPLAPLDRRMETDRLVHAGKSPIEQRLAPGDYLVVAYSDDRRQFHEVYRRVPEPKAIDSSAKPSLHAHLRWKKIADNYIELPSVRLFDQETVASRLARIRGGHWKPPTADPNSHLEKYVPDFLIGPTETTYAMLTAKQLAAVSRRSAAFKANEPITDVDWDVAIAIAEQHGMRLPTQSEYAWIVTQQGRRYDAENWPVIPDPVPGPVEQPQWDRLKFPGTSTPLIGLRSNVVEWTASSPQSTLNSSMLRSIAGGLTMDDPQDLTNVKRPPESLAAPNSTRHARLGFRFARSIRPRVSRADFEQTTVIRKLKPQHKP